MRINCDLRSDNMYQISVGGRAVHKSKTKSNAEKIAKKFRESIALQKKRGHTKGRVNRVTIRKI